MNRFLFYLLTLLLGVGASAPATAQHCAMVQTLHYTSSIGNGRLVTDPAGNTYYAGCFQGALDVAGTQIAADPNDPSVNLYVAKFDATGQLLWLKHGGSPGTEISYAMALDGIGGLYVTGTNGPGFAFDGGGTLDSAGTHLMKFDTGTGTLLWSRLVGNSTFTRPNVLRGIGVWSLAANSTGLYFGGVAELNPSLDGVSLQTTPFGRTALVAKCTLGGVVTAVWQGTPLVDSALIQAPFIALDPNGDVVVSGGYTRTVQFGTAAGSPVHTATLLSPISRAEHFLLHLSLGVPGGTTLSVMPRLPWLTTLKVDTHGDCYISGYSPRDAIGTAALPDSGMYVARLSRQGAVRWATGNHMPGSGLTIVPGGLVVDTDGRVYSYGRINGVSAQFGTYTVVANGGAFYLCHDSTGAVQWARGADNPNTGNADIAQGFAIDAANRLYAGGVTYTSLNNVPTRYDGLVIRPGSAYLLRFDPAAEVSGHVYLDQNANGQRDAGESAFPRSVAVEEVTNPNGAVCTSDTSGLYHALLPPGAYALQTVPPAYYTVSTPMNNRQTGTLTAFGQVQSGRDFGLAPVPNRTDVRITYTAYSVARRGFANRYRVRVENVGTTPATGTATVLLAPALAYSGAMPAPDQQIGSVAQWNFTNLAPFGILNYDIAATAPITVALGTVLRSWASVAVAGDLTPLNNVDSLTQVLVSSYDPNDLTVSHTTLTPAQVAAGTPLDYTIRFQNMGADTAFNVVITDTLPARLLRLGTLTPLSTSHRCTLDVLGNNQVVIRFEHINLPPRSTSVLNSMGFVRFAVEPSAALQPGALIPNTAHIVFDYNAPLATNGVSTLVQAPNGLVAEAGAEDARMRLYPNPADQAGFVTLTADAGPATVAILDALSRAVSTAHFSPDTSHLDVRGLTPGLYVVRLTRPDGTTTSRRLVVR